MPEGIGEYVTMAVESAISMGVVVSSGTLRSINDKLRELKNDLLEKIMLKSLDHIES